MEPTKELVTWLLLIVATNLSAVILAIMSWVKAAKMIPRDIKAADLDNQAKEGSVADQFNTIAIKAAEQATILQGRLLRIEGDYNILKSAHDELVKKVILQDIALKEQLRTVEAQTARINQQDGKISEQEELISSLRFDLNATTEYNYILIAQMKEKNLVPVESPKHRKTNERVIVDPISPK